MLEYLVMLSLDHIPEFHPPPAVNVVADRRTRPKQCDDGTSIYHADGTPNWDCELDGCGMLEPVCWSARIDFCFDEDGNETGECVWRTRQKCTTKWSCIKLWAGCDGPFEYDWDTGVGVCTPMPLRRAILIVHKPETAHENRPQSRTGSKLSNRGKTGMFEGSGDGDV